MYGNPQLVDPEFRRLIREKFKKYRLPVVKWFSLLELPWGPPVSYGLTKGGERIEYLFAKEATKKFSSFSSTRNFVYVRGYKAGWFSAAKVVRGIGIVLAIATAAATGADIGTWLYSYWEALEEYGK